MLIPNKFSGYQAGIRLYPGGKGGGSAPAPDPLIGQAAMKQAQTGDDMLAFIKQSWADQQPRLDAQDKLNQQVIGQNMRLAQNAEDRANDAYSFYKNEGRPVISQTLKDASDWDSEANIDKARGQVSADIQSSMDKQSAATNRTLTRMGINPNSTKFAALNQQLAAQKGLAQAGAMNAAGEDRKMQGVQLRQQASNLASGMPATSMGFSGQSSGMGGTAAGVGQAGLAGRQAATNSMISGMGSAGSMYGGAASAMNQSYSTQMSGYNAQQAANASSAAGLGSLVGTIGGAMVGGPMGAAIGGALFKADGGKIEGPGTGISDSVPARNVDTGQEIRLSNGEYVLPADVVKKIGTHKLDQLVKQHHTPAAQQRARGNLGKH